MALKELCGCSYDESSSYQLLRVLKEQAVENGDGTLRLRTKGDGGMDASILQNPADPDATARYILLSPKYCKHIFGFQGS